jgi:hypothetical protein
MHTIDISGPLPESFYDPLNRLAGFVPLPKLYELERS